MSMASPLPTPIPLPDELRALRAKAHSGAWSVWEKDGSGWDAHADELHGRVQSETHDIADFFHDEDRDFVVALVNWFDTLTATKPSEARAESAEREAEKLREALRTARMWGVRSAGFDAAVASDLARWIDAGFQGEPARQALGNQR